ncbi:hypothetical protein IKQ26_05235 [bacterium]|nr:hypothetical protein [bacterium]
MEINKEKALFDPGFNPILNHFIPVYTEFSNLLTSTPKQSVKKKLYLVNAPLVKNSLKSTVGFWKGCILWAVYLKNHFNEPQPIEGNTMQNIDEEEIQFIHAQNNLIENYFKSYSSEVKKYIGIHAELPEIYKEIFEDYKEFTELNNHFSSTKLTSELKLTKKYDKEYSEEELENLFNSVQEIINSKDLSLFINLDY